MTDQKHDVICVLGMHRSGTSCLTGSLQEAGLSLGEHHTWNPYNKRGNRENQDFVDFHEQLLADNGASWDVPPRRMRFTVTHLDRARALVDSFSAERCWGFKDPRSLLALALWQDVIPKIHYVGIFRHPRAVARSLGQRSGGKIKFNQSYELWYHYNRILHRQLRRQAFPLLCFDWEEQQFHDALDSVVSALGLEKIATDQRFYTAELKQTDVNEWSGIPWRVKRLYRKLLAIAANPTGGLQK